MHGYYEYHDPAHRSRVRAIAAAVSRALRYAANPAQDRYWRRLEALRADPLVFPHPLLDVGCGNGELMLRLRGRGWSVKGIEPGKSAEAARARGLEVEVVAIERASFPDESFGLVIANHVLEHLEAPSQAVERIFRWLKPGGVALVRLPVCDSVAARVFGRFWSQLDAPRHRVLFTRRGLKSLLAGSGLAIEELFSDAYGFGIWPSFAYMCGMSLGSVPDAFLRSLNLLFTPLAAVTNLLGTGDQVTIIARRPRRMASPTSSA
jgi:SAM-dependent methyltransferase